MARATEVVRSCLKFVRVRLCFINGFVNLNKKVCVSVIIHFKSFNHLVHCKSSALVYYEIKRFEMDKVDGPSVKPWRAFAASEDEEIVASGMSGRFPESDDIDELEYNLYNKVSFLFYFLLTIKRAEYSFVS